MVRKEEDRIVNYNCQKRAYKARSIQWDGTNTEEVLDVFPNARLHGSNHLMVRHAEGVSTLELGAYIVIGENGEVKAYTEETYHVKYEVLP